MNPFCKYIEELPQLNDFVSYSCWSTPGLNIMQSKLFKRNTKLTQLIHELGYNGPITDVVLRGTVSHMLVCNYEEDTRSICGIMIEFVNDHLKNDSLSKVITSWGSNNTFTQDFEISYRQKRSELISYQVAFLTQNPRNLVC